MDEGERGEVREVQHKIVTGDTPPVRQQARRVPFALKGKVIQMVNEMLQGGVVRESCSPWASPIVLVKKKNGDLRFCVDFRCDSERWSIIVFAVFRQIFPKWVAYVPVTGRK